MVITFWSALALIFASMMIGFTIGVMVQYAAWRRKITSHYSVYACNIEALKSALEQRSVEEFSGCREHPISHLDSAAMN